MSVVVNPTVKSSTVWYNNLQDMSKVNTCVLFDLIRLEMKKVEIEPERLRAEAERLRCETALLTAKQRSVVSRKRGASTLTDDE